MDQTAHDTPSKRGSSKLRSSFVIKNAGPTKIFPPFPLVAAILAKWSAIGADIRCEQIPQQQQRLMKTHSRAVWNKRSIL
jgi:hypothetical protein